MKAFARIAPSFLLKLAPSVLGTLGTLAYCIRADWFLAFCGGSHGI